MHLVYYIHMTHNDNPQTSRDIHHEANIARELRQDFPASLAEADKAMKHYAEDGNMYGIAEALCSRALTLRHIADAMKVEAFRVQALHEVMAALEIVTKAGESKAIILQNLGKIQRELGNIEAALDSFRSALQAQETHPHETQDRPGVLANFKEMVATAELGAGDDSALERAEAALAELEATDEDSYNKAVWLSHGHGRIAAALVERNPEVARRHYEAAKAIIDADERLKLSAGKLKNLAASLGIES